MRGHTCVCKSSPSPSFPSWNSMGHNTGEMFARMTVIYLTGSHITTSGHGIG